MSVDVRELITLDDVMQELQLGPNGCVLLGGCAKVNTSKVGAAPPMLMRSIVLIANLL